MRKVLLASAVIAGLMSACVSQTRHSSGDIRREPPHSSEKFYLEALERSRPVFRIDPAGSLAVIEVRRSGSLAGLGHDHVVASHDIQGYVAPDDGRSDLYVQLDRLTVDEPPLRAEAGFDSQPSAAFIEGTRQNMLQKVLEIDQHPFALVSVRRPDANDPAGELNIAMTLHGTTRTLHVPVQIENSAEELTVSGRLTLNQTDFGMIPFSILGGAIAVQDLVNIRFRIRASRMVSPRVPDIKE